MLHVVEHFSYHTGQIIFATKHVTGEDLGFYRHLSFWWIAAWWIRTSGTTSSDEAPIE